MKHVEKLVFAGALLALGDPVMAGTTTVPAPIAGVGIGAVVLIGFGYRMLKRRINP